MKEFSNAYVFKFALIMVFVVALLLSLAATLLQPLQERNEMIEKQRNILAAMDIDVSTKDAAEKYKEIIQDQFVVNVSGERIEGSDPLDINLRLELAKPEEDMLLPVYIGHTSPGDKIYILPVHGKGLWGPVWGYIALKEDINTIFGVYFDHAKETPGLGAEIADAPFQERFRLKKLFDEEGVFQSVAVQKSHVDDSNPHAVQALSGATITSRGIDNMLSESLHYYLAFIKKEK